MKKKLIVTLCTAVSALLSCNGNSRLPVVNNSDIILELANKIKEHQAAPDFAGLNHFSYMYRRVEEMNQRTYQKAVKSKNEEIVAYNFDLDKLVFREYYMEANPNPQIGTVLEETYLFYDTNAGKICRAKNINNYKSFHYEEEMSKDKATQYFKNTFSKLPIIRGIIKEKSADIHLLDKVPDIIEEIKESEPLDKSKGEHCNPYYGSKDERSLQIISDLKRYFEGKWDGVFNYAGSISTKKETRFENDYLVYYEDTNIVDIKASENNYFFNGKTFNTIEVNQDKSLINPPDITKYTPEGN